MKKLILIPLICLTLLFAACGYDEFDPEKYVGDGLRTAFGVIVDQNQHFYNDVFVLGHLKANEKKAVKKDGKTYAPVTDSEFGSYDELVSALKATYTDDCVTQILDNYDCYIDIDGALFVDTDADYTSRKAVKWERDPAFEAEFEGKTENSFTMEYRFTCGKKDELDEFTFVRVENGYRLTELQYVD